jgi:hypothetical protein
MMALVYAVGGLIVFTVLGLYLIHPVQGLLVDIHDRLTRKGA